MREKVLQITCDVCGKEVDAGEVLTGAVRVEDTEEVRFDLCADDFEKLFGKLDVSPRRGSRGKAAAAA